jgi:ABC-type amino acid transport system permease subunit
MNSVANLGHNWLTAFEQLPALLIGLQYTAIVSICSFLAALAVGLLVALVRLSSIHWIRNVAFFISRFSDRYRCMSTSCSSISVSRRS